MTTKLKISRHNFIYIKTRRITKIAILIVPKIYTNIK